MSHEHYVITCECGKTHRTTETAFTCQCGRLQVVCWRAETVPAKPQPPTISARYEK